jgi:hypothetical protein
MGKPYRRRKSSLSSSTFGTHNARKRWIEERGNERTKKEVI